MLKELIELNKRTMDKMCGLLDSNHAFIKYYKNQHSIKVTLSFVVDLLPQKYVKLITPDYRDDMSVGDMVREGNSKYIQFIQTNDEKAKPQNYPKPTAYNQTIMLYPLAENLFVMYWRAHDQDNCEESKPKPGFLNVFARKMDNMSEAFEFFKKVYFRIEKSKDWLQWRQ